MNSKWFAIVLTLLTLAVLPLQVFAQNTTYTITASAGAGGNINPSGPTTVTSGGSQSYTIIPNAGYKITDVQVDGNSIGTPFGYTFSNVTGNHTISASFGLLTRTAGRVLAWGDNSALQCSVPYSGIGFVAVAGGEFHTIGLKADGSIRSYGNNSNGECNTPSPNSGFASVTAGSGYSLALKLDGSVTLISNLTRFGAPSPNSGFAAISGGYQHCLGLKVNGSVVAWGDNYYGQRNVPSPNSGFVAVAAGYYHSLGLKSDGSVVAWGNNEYGQCNVPSSNTGFVAIAAGAIHSLGLKADGSVVIWGDNSEGQCNIPYPNSGFVAVSVGAGHNLGLKANGTVVAWGYNEYRQCNIPSPNSGFVATSAGYCHSLAITTSTPQPGRVIHVSQLGNDSDGLTWATAKKTIAGGVALAKAYDQVWVAKGTYYECITLPLEVSLFGGFAGNERSLSERSPFPRSENDVNETILDGQKNGCVVKFTSGSGYMSNLDGFTIQNGYSGSGGVNCNAASPRICNNKIRYNSNPARNYTNAWGIGGGLCLWNSDAFVENNIVANNTSSGYGGGIHIYGGSPTISNNTITKNNPSGIFAERSDVTISGNTVSENTTTYHGGGMSIFWCNGVVEGNTVTNNTTPHVGGGIDLAFGGAVMVKNNIIRGNQCQAGGGGVWMDARAMAYPSPLLSVTLENNIIDGNISKYTNGSYDGGGVGIICNPIVKIIGNQITNNRSYTRGGGISIQTGDGGNFNNSPVVANNLIKGNTSKQGSGIYTSLRCPGQYINNTIVCNTSTESASVVSIAQEWTSALPEEQRMLANNIIAFNSGGVYLGSTILARNNDSFGNTNGVNYSPASLLGSNGNISVDPLFASKSSGNYSLSPSSMCIDAGDNSWVQTGWTDILGKARIFNSIVDMGAYECGAAGSIVDGKLYPIGFSVDIPSAVVSASFDDCFYVQNSDNLSGIRVEKAYACIHQGSTVHVKGTASVLPNGELAIIPTDVQYVSDPDVPVVTKPVAIRNRFIGGVALGSQPAVKNGRGLNNVGLLVRVSGNITSAAWDSSWIKIKDGSGTEVKCILPYGTRLNTACGFAVVTGVCSCEKVNGDIYPVIRVRSHTDIVQN